MTKFTWGINAGFARGVDEIAGINATSGMPRFQGGGVMTGSVALNGHSFGYLVSGGNTIVLVNTSNTAETAVSAVCVPAAETESSSA